MTTKLKYLLFAVLAILVALFIYNRYRVAPGVNFDDLSLQDMDGKPVRFSEFKEKKLIVSFGASWCGNCIMELKALNKIREKELSDIEVIIISDEPLEQVRRFKETRGPYFTFLKMNADFGSIGVNAIPTTYLFNKQSENVYKSVGDIHWEDEQTLVYLKKLLD
jgi:thiol-disulfide isomerase/thioredoxin